MTVKIITGDCRDVLPSMDGGSVNCVVTSPPYFGLRDYGADGQMGLEPTPDAYVNALVALFRDVRRVLRDDGTLWLNLGDSYAAARGGTHMPASTLGGGAGGKTIDGDRVNQGRKDGYTPSRDSHAIGLKHKDLIGIPWRVALAMQADGWWLRQDIIWHKPNPMPESVRDRCTRSHEYIFMFSKSAKYYYDAGAIAEPAIYSGLKNQSPSGYKDAKSFDGKHSDKQRGHGRRHAGFNDRWDKTEKSEQCSGTRNKRSVWTVATRPFSGAHFATFPADLITPCILAGCRAGGTVLDPFGGSGTTGLVADRLGRNAILIEINPNYSAMAADRIKDDAGLFSRVAAGN